MSTLDNYRVDEAIITVQELFPQLTADDLFAIRLSVMDKQDPVDAAIQTALHLTESSTETITPPAPATTVDSRAFQPPQIETDPLPPAPSEPPVIQANTPASNTSADPTSSTVADEDGQQPSQSSLADSVETGSPSTTTSSSTASGQVWHVSTAISSDQPTEGTVSDSLEETEEQEPSTQEPATQKPATQKPSPIRKKGSAPITMTELAAIRQQNLLARGLITPEQLAEKDKRSAHRDSLARAEAKKTTKRLEYSRQKAIVTSKLREKWLQQRAGVGRIHTLADAPYGTDEESNAFLAEAAKKNPSIIPPDERLGRRMLELTNEYRKSKGLPPCTWDREIYKVCCKHSKEMADGKKGFNHNGFHQRVSSLPFPTLASGENLFMTSMEEDLARQAVDGWIHSPGHERNLRGNFTHCGIGTVQRPGGYYYVTQIFVHK